MRYEVDIQIAAEPEVVWATLADVQKWPEWTSSTTSVTRLEAGPLAVGSTARVVQPRLRPAVFTVTACEPGKSFTWAAKAPGVKTVAGHYIEPGEDGRSAVRLVLEQSGLLSVFVGLLAGGLIRRYLTLEAEGLRQRSESGPAPVNQGAV